MRKEASLELWRELYEVALNLRLLDPWEHFWDSDLVAIQRKDVEEIVFCSIMGRGGRCYGISIYEGQRGLEDMDMIASIDELGLPGEYVMCDQSCLCCYFGDREEVPKKQKEVIKELGLKFRGAGNWVYFESYKKRFTPYIPDEREVKILIEAFQNLFMAVRAVKEERIHIRWDEGEILCRVYNPERKEWNMFAGPRPDARREYPHLMLKDEVSKMRLKKQPKIDAELSIDFVYLMGDMLDENYDRPLNPLVFVVMDEAADIIVEMQMISPKEEEAETVLQFFCNFVQQNGRVRVVKARNPSVFAALEDICAYCGIKLEKAPLEKLDEMIEGMKNRL